MKEATLWLAGLILSLSVIYGFYWVGKTVSYKLFYQDMVRGEIQQMVNAESLKKAWY